MDKTDCVSVASLAALKEKRLTGAFPAGNFLLLDSVPSRSDFHQAELILQFVELATAGVTIVTLSDSVLPWGKYLSADLGMLMLTVAELVLMQSERDLRSQRAKMSHQQRRERLAQASKVAQ